MTRLMPRTQIGRMRVERTLIFPAWWGIVAAAAAGGCYYAASVRRLAPAPGTNVTVTLAPVARVQALPQLGSDASVLEGRLLASTPDSVAIAVSHVARFDEKGEMWHGERVALPFQFIARVQRRRLSIPRTTLVIVGLAAGVVMAARILDVNAPRATY